jgi:hypothetical protein
MGFDPLHENMFGGYSQTHRSYTQISNVDLSFKINPNISSKIMFRSVHNILVFSHVLELFHKYTYIYMLINIYTCPCFPQTVLAAPKSLPQTVLANRYEEEGRGEAYEEDENQDE